MKKDNKRKVKGKISTKKEAKETIDKFKSVSGEREVDLEKRRRCTKKWINYCW